MGCLLAYKTLLIVCCNEMFLSLQVTLNVSTRTKPSKMQSRKWQSLFWDDWWFSVLFQVAKNIVLFLNFVLTDLIGWLRTITQRRRWNGAWQHLHLGSLRALPATPRPAQSESIVSAGLLQLRQRHQSDSFCFVYPYFEFVSLPVSLAVNSTNLDTPATSCSAIISTHM